MSINSIQIVPAEEKYAPPEQIIDFAVIDDPDHGPLVCLSLSDYEQTDKLTSATHTFDFPPIRVSDLCRALAAFGVGVAGFHVAMPAGRLPEAPDAPS